MKNYVIIGGGIASLGCIEGIRSIDKVGKITVICEESVPPYARPLISYYLENKTDFEKMQYRDAEFYKNNNINFIFETKAVKISDHNIQCNDGTTINFDKLLVATGSSPFIPQIEGFDSVTSKFTFMTENDALSLKNQVTKDSKVLIVGAGLIGLKCAEGLRNLVKEITVCDLSDRVLSSILDDECAHMIESKLNDNNIELMLSDTVEHFDNKKAFMKSGKIIEFDILVMAVGVKANVSLLKDCGANVNRGVLVNDKMETSLPDIYAAGDLTEAKDISSNTDKVMAILPNAYMEGFCAGCNMTGTENKFDNQIPMNSIGFFGLHLMTAGSYSGDLYKEKTVNGIKKLYVKDNRLVGFIIIGNVEKTGIYTYLIRNKVPLDTIDFNAIKKNPSLLPFSYEYRRKNLGGVL